MRIFDSPASIASQVKLLSNGHYQVVISNAGGGYSRWRDLAVTRWREDATRDCWGHFHLSARACHGRILVHRFSADLAPS